MHKKYRVALLAILSASFLFSQNAVAAFGDYIGPVALGAPFETPVGLENNQSDNLLITDIDSDFFTTINAAGVVIGGQFSLAGTNALGIATDGVYVFITDTISDEVQTYNMSGVFQSSFSVAGQTDFPEGITFDPASGHLFVVGGSAENLVFEYLTDGTYITSYPVQGSSQDGLTYDPGVNGFWLYDSGTDMVRHYDTEFVELESFPGTVANGLAGGEGLAVIGNQLFVVATSSDAMGVFDISGAINSSPNATFRVSKEFSDGNPAEVTVTINCFTGLPITQSQTISSSQDVNFIVESFADGELDCDVTEDVDGIPGYAPEYLAAGTGASSDADGCHYEDVTQGARNTCHIINSPIPVEVSVFKDWVIDGQGGDTIDAYYRLVLACHGVIIDGNTHGPSGIYRKELYNGSYLGTADAEFNADVVPDWDGGTACWVLETVYDSAVEVSNGCGSNGNEGLLVELAGGDSCTITNTVFFEGIPTLSQYGMAILALLMLGVGFVGFRRFV